ncbi:hypothetical protein PPERSA_01619 [Pseudocohnilembus persalinus]|uniref:C2 domain n=1 Tax=Pseudocohnilembus persalinus TaxID=266149 RepID=A0A0V0QI99_PSEPJ|nr:hypothetical protein PPERSA_01619 [Pseudocohnilembus persalinus]|eukprot:KRX01749.1 hypothetical protein PPERSA_01619 [Pseudocohnilembus persalinus]
MKRQQRIEEIEKFFIKKFPNASLDREINQQDLKVMLDQLTRENGFFEYDDEIYNELVEQMQLKERYVTLRHFINIFIEAEQILNMKIEHLDTLIQKVTDSIEYIKDMTEELNKRDQYDNNQGNQQFKKNYLVLTGISIQNLNNITGTQNYSPYLQLEIGKYYYNKTQQMNNSSPNFDLRGTKLELHNLTDQISIRVIDDFLEQTNQSYKSEYGLIELSIDALPFFEDKQIQYNLIKDGSPLNTIIQITCHLEVNNYRQASVDLQQKLQFFWNQLDEQRIEKKDCEDQLKGLQTPFQVNYTNLNDEINQVPLYKDSNQTNQQKLGYYDQNNFQEPNYQHQYNQDQKQTNNDQSHLYQEQQFKQMNNQNDQQLFNPNQIEQPQYQEQHQNYQSPQYIQNKNHQYNANNEVDEEDFLDITNLLNKPQYLAFIMVILAIICCLERPQLVDILIGSGFIFFLKLAKFNEHNYEQILLYLLCGIGFTCFLDILWMIFYLSAFSDKKKCVDQGEESFQRGLVIVFTFLLFFWKFLVAGSFFVARSQSFHQQLANVQASVSEKLEESLHKSRLLNQSQLRIRQGSVSPYKINQ